jgi:cytochrome c5
VGQEADKAFLKNVSIVLVVLIVFTFGIVFVARDLGFQDEEGSNPSRNAIASERIKPVADVYTGEKGAAAIEETAVTAAPEQTVAFDGSLDGEMIYSSVCAACHATGVANAPKPGSAEMSQRAEKGADAVTKTAIDGLNAMPARGGRPDLSDEQIKAVVEFMLK